MRRPLAAGVRAIRRPGVRSIALAAAAAGLLALHALAVDHFLPFEKVFSSALLQGGDYDTHIGQTLRVIEGLHGWGKSWVYDVKLLAGQPEGTIFDGDNKGWEIWTYAAMRLGLSQAYAFNTFVLVAMLACPLVVFAAARLFGLGVAASLLAGAMASTLWFFDSFCHWAWWIGMIAYAFASYFALLPLALFYRFVEHGSRRSAIGCALINGAAHLIHPYTFFMLAVPMLAIYLRARRRLSRGAHVGVLLIGAFTIGVNAFWLLPAFAHWHYILDSAYFGATGLQYIAGDFFNVLIDPDDSGVIGTRAGFRFLYVALATAGIALLHARRDPRALPFGAALATLFALGYFGTYIPGALQIQPYRHVLPLGFFAVLPAAAFCQTLARERVLVRLGRPAQALLAVAAMVAVQHLVGEALYFTPELLREPDGLMHGDPSPLTAYGFMTSPHGRSHIHYGVPADPWIDNSVEDVVRWIGANLPPGSRLLAEHMTIGERTAWKTHTEVMGGFRERNVQHSLANFFRRYGTKTVSDAELERYLRTYGIGWIVTLSRRQDFETSALLEKLPPIGQWSLYRTRFPVSPFAKNSGQLRARTNSIQVYSSNPTEDVVMRYHWHEALRCTPSCRVARSPVQDDAVGFIRVPAPHPPDFIVYNSYEY
jgi:hypothetical protein